ncbi:MAG: NAD-dependent epimerase/dehydratase family protein [Candidatus Andersenbacteria bacterium]
MSHILITGGAGFIGSHTARALLRRGDQVTLLDDFNDRYDPRLKEARIKHMFTGVPAPDLVRGDIRDRKLLEKYFSQQKFDQVIHLAAWASVQPSIENPYIYTEVNVDGTVNILEMCRQYGVKNLIFASSSSVYGGQKEVPFREDANVSNPLSPYAATKAAGEILCATWHNLYGLPVSCLRFFTVYGPWGRPEMAIFKFTEAILTGRPIEMRGKTTMRDFTYIDDIVQGVIGALDHPHGFSIYNLGENDSVSLPRLISGLESALGKKANVQEVSLPVGDIPRTLADITKARNELGYNPTTSIEEGVKKFVDWYQQQYEPLFLSMNAGVPQST